MSNISYLQFDAEVQSEGKGEGLHCPEVYIQTVL